MRKALGDPRDSLNFCYNSGSILRYKTELNFVFIYSRPQVLGMLLRIETSNLLLFFKVQL